MLAIGKRMKTGELMQKYSPVFILLPAFRAVHVACYNTQREEFIAERGFEQMPRRFHGIIPPLITPLTDRDTLDVAGLEKLLNYVLASGVHGIFLLGTTGEAPSLSYRLRREVITLASQIINQRVPLLVGVTDTSFVESVALAEHAANAGAADVVLTTPYYFPAGQTELVGYIRNITAQLPLPLMLYNMPGLTKVWFDHESLQKLTDVEQIVGIKDSSGDLEYFGRLMELRRTRPDWSILIGPEAYLPAAMKLGGDGGDGADGGVSGGANVLPRLFVACYDACVAGDQPRIAELAAAINDLQSIYDIGKYASRFIKATKCAASLLGLCDDFMAEPFHRFHPPDRERVWQILEPLAARFAGDRT